VGSALGACSHFVEDESLDEPPVPFEEWALSIPPLVPFGAPFFPLEALVALVPCASPGELSIFPLSSL
jgi:hypothetical protein